MTSTQPNLLHGFFERQVGLRPNHPAVRCKGEELTYSQLDQQASRIAMSLRRRGLGPGSLVAIYLEKSCGLFAALLGVLKAGAAYLPIDPSSPIARIQNIFTDAGIDAVISEGLLGTALQSNITGEVMFVGELDRSVEPARQDDPVIVTPTAICYVIYTSGSTGRPKGVMVEHRNAVNFVRALRSVYRLDGDDRVYQGFSIAFDASVEEIWAAFSVGGTLVVPSEEVARSTFEAADFINSERISFFSTVPSFLATIDADLPTVRLLVVGGETCAPELVTRWATPTRRMLNTYGPTEATVVATAARCVAGEPVTIGTALPGYMIWVVNERMEPVQPGEIGELYIGGEGVARGYLNSPELTAEYFVRNPLRGASSSDRLYRTRDLVRLTASGALQYVGRADGQVKIRGFRIELSEIEAVLMEHPSIRSAAVNVVQFGPLKELAAYVVPRADEGEMDRRSIVELLRCRVPEYMVPRYLDVVPNLPTMASGKMDRRLLPPPCQLLIEESRSIVAPKTDLERKILAVWEKLLHACPISVEDDFFLDLRGHSLTAAQVVTELRSTLGASRISVRDIYEHRTIRRLASHITTNEGGNETSHPSAVASGDRAAELARPTLSAWRRLLCASLQLAGLLAYYAILSAPVVFAVVVVVQVVDGERNAWQAIDLATTISFFIWPSWLCASIAVKWIVIGRYKAGRYPVWSLYYFRWWLVTRFQTLGWSEMFVSTPLMSLYYRAMGAKVGRHCSIGTPLCAAFDLVEIGDGSSIGSDTHMLGYRVENGWLILGNITIGHGCFVGTHCSLGLNTAMADRARLGDMSLLADNSVVGPGQTMRGSPAEIAAVDVPQSPDPGRRSGRTFLFGLIHLALIYAMGYLLILSALPGLALVGYALYSAGPAWGIGAALAAAPMCTIWYLLLVVAVKRIAIGRIHSGTFSLQSAEYLRYWFLTYLLNNTRHIVLGIYATLFLPKFLRLLGAKIGRAVEISTAMRIMPDLLEVGDGGFLADACIVGGHSINDGLIDVRANKIGRRTFVGNSALVPAGVELGDNCLLGVMSVPPSDTKRQPDGSRWLGSPSFQLPHTQGVTCFSEKQTFEPTYGLVAARVLIELLRVFVPGLMATAVMIVFCAAIALAYHRLPLRAIVPLASGLALLLSVIAVALVAAVKRLLMGKYEPVVQPLWSRYVWINELVNGLYESVAAVAMVPLMATPFIGPCLRFMGCKIGRWVFLETTLFSEFDLVEIGDFAALNLGATIQTHLFEDRVMKADALRIGEGCSVGNMSVVLYGTHMQKGSSLGPLSVLMKGEILPALSRWSGIPTRPMEGRRPSIGEIQASSQSSDEFSSLVQVTDVASVAGPLEDERCSASDSVELI